MGNVKSWPELKQAEINNPAKGDVSEVEKIKVA